MNLRSSQAMEFPEERKLKSKLGMDGGLSTPAIEHPLTAALAVGFLESVLVISRVISRHSHSN